MPKTKNLIIGANSFLSRAISQQLLAAGEEVEGVIHRNTDKLLSNISYHKMEALTSLPDDYTQVYIVSAYIPKGNESSAELQQRLYEANIQLPQLVVQHFSRAKIIYASSVSVYTEQEEALNEQSETKHLTAYGSSKLWGEAAIKTASQYAIVRISSMYGEGMNTSTFLPRMIQQALQEQTLKVWGDGSRAQNYIAVQDVARYMIAAAQYTKNGTYLGVDTCSYTNLEIAQIIQQYTNCALEYTGVDNSHSYYYDNQNTQQQLNFKPTNTLAHHIESLIEWNKKKY